MVMKPDDLYKQIESKSAIFINGFGPAADIWNALKFDQKNLQVLQYYMKHM